MINYPIPTYNGVARDADLAEACNDLNTRLAAIESQPGIPVLVRRVEALENSLQMPEELRQKLGLTAPVSAPTPANPFDAGLEPQSHDAWNDAQPAAPGDDAGGFRWTLDDGSVIDLLTREQFAALLNGTKLVAIDGEEVTKGVDEIDQDIRSGRLAFGIRVSAPGDDAAVDRQKHVKVATDVLRHADRIETTSFTGSIGLENHHTLNDKEKLALRVCVEIASKHDAEIAALKAQLAGAQASCRMASDHLVAQMHHDMSARERKEDTQKIIDTLHASRGEDALRKAWSRAEVAENECDQARADLAALLHDTANALGCDVDNESVLHKAHDLRADLARMAQGAELREVVNKDLRTELDARTEQLRLMSDELACVTAERDEWKTAAPENMKQIVSEWESQREVVREMMAQRDRDRAKLARANKDLDAAEDDAEHWKDRHDALEGDRAKLTAELAAAKAWEAHAALATSRARKAEDELGEAKALLLLLRNGISHAQMAPCLDASWHMQAESFVRQADAIVAAGGAVGK